MAQLNNSVRQVNNNLKTEASETIKFNTELLSSSTEKPTQADLFSPGNL